MWATGVVRWSLRGSGRCPPSGPRLCYACGARVLRLVPKPTKRLWESARDAYAHLLIGLLVILAGCLVLTIIVSLLGL